MQADVQDKSATVYVELISIISPHAEKADLV